LRPGLARSLDSLLKLRRAPELVDFSSSVVDGPLSVAGDTLESSATPNETNEATDAREIATNEPTLAAGVGLESPTYTNAPEQNLTIEPDARENMTNEATDACENATNEPTAHREAMTNEAAVAADVGLESPTYMKAAEQNLTFEPAFATPSGGSQVGDIYLAQVIRPSWRTPAESGLTSSAGPAID
jgi:hypothetical protein